MLFYLPWRSGHRSEFFRNFLLQVYFTFIQSIYMLMFLGFSAGVVISFQSNMGLSLFGGDNQVGRILVFVLFRELTPIACSIILIARSVTAMAAELATIKVQQEIEALNVMGISVYHYLLAPRIAASMVSLFCMAVIFWIFSLAGGWYGVNYSGHMPVEQFLNSIALSIRPGDLVFFAAKTLTIGGVVSYIACNRGLSLRNAPFEVPIVTNKAVVDSLTVAIATSLAFSALFYLIHGFAL
jgi:phospholipid/cholesterol/gamma-HCH transport system permease protein